MGYRTRSSIGGCRLLDVVAGGRVPLGMQCFTGHPAIIDILGLAGFDFVMLDCEHSGHDARAIDGLVRTCEAAGLIPLVRVTQNDPADIRRALEAGADGVIVPLVKSAADMQRALDAARFPPLGKRGMCPSTRASGYTLDGWDDHVRWTNGNALVIPLIEHPDAVDNIEEICAMDGVKALCFGPGDLGQAMGVGVGLFDNDLIRDAFEKTVACAKRHAVEVIGFPVSERGVKEPMFSQRSPEACRRMVEQGVRIFMIDVDEMIFRRHCDALVRELGDGLVIAR